MRGIRAIASRATFRKRKAYLPVPVPPPVMIAPPVVDTPYKVHPTYGWAGYWTYPTITISATPGVWDDTDGVPTVVGQWVDLDDQPVADPDATDFQVPADAQEGEIYTWKETATRSGVVEVYYHEPSIEVVSAPFRPGIKTYGQITGDLAPGSTLTKPAHVWNSPLQITVEGEWYKNGVATGVTTDTYSDTVEGDVMLWNETATDDLLQSRSTSELYRYAETYSFLVGVAHEALSDQMAVEVDALIAGKTGGTTQDLWGSYDATIANTYGSNPPLDRNPDFFAPELLRQLTGVAAWKGPWGQYNCYTAITPRHVISCAHGSMGTTEVWFVRDDGLIHKNAVIKQVNDYGLWKGVIKPSAAPKETMEADLQVGLLRDELPEWVMKYPVIQMTAVFLKRMRDYINPPTLYVSQGDATPARFPNSPSIWTLRGQKLCVSAVNHGNVTDPQRLLFRRYALVNGDSGCPEFILVNGTLHLLRTFTSAGGDGGRLGEHVAYVNRMIWRVDNAHGIDTGYTLNIATLPTSEDKEPFLATDSLIELADGSILTRNI